MTHSPSLGFAAWAAALVVVAVSSAAPASAQQAVIRDGLVEEFLTVPVEIDALFGRSVYKLAAYVARPAGEGPMPFAVLNHGKPPSGHAVRNLQVGGMSFHAREFARRGYYAVTFLRRGYGESEGHQVSTGGCKGTNRTEEGFEAAKDVNGIIAWLKTKPQVDAARGLVVGQSHGGFTTVATAATNPPGVVAAINFAGGIDNRESRCGESWLVEAMQNYGAVAKVPMLWVYTENDLLFGPALSGAMFNAFVGAGGKADYKLAPPFKDNGHYLFSMDGTTTWAPYVDDFLRRVGLPTWRKEAAESVAKDFTDPAAMAALQRYLASPGEKAFAYGGEGRFGWQWHPGKSTDEIKTMALKSCESKPGTGTCSLRMVNYDVVAR